MDKYKNESVAARYASIWNGQKGTIGGDARSLILAKIHYLSEHALVSPAIFLGLSSHSKRAILHSPKLTSRVLIYFPGYCFLLQLNVKSV